eukprot:CAMPEP_0174856776 /NCGR_PEP_ID=MMETSP1114-20130205/36210_1 /TAXON_ID=312471 /ORGANISM="Neobodo designis, Strain CCAP 1951/1" /LENGTH=391 /DNA_ID=CAMNT_0016091581 /DNA_START=47 /DNA_END=1222 /DNA_ORIENTATION=-
MSVASLPVLAKNAKQIVPGLIGFAGNLTTNVGLLKKFRDRQWNNAPQEHRDVAEEWDTDYWKRGFDQKKNMWVDKELHTEMTRKDIAQIMQFKMDSWRVAAWGLPTAVTGGFGLAVLPFWLANDTWMPSTVPQTPEALAEWREAQDLYRYKHSPAVCTIFRWWLEHNGPVPDKWAHGWEELCNERNNVRRDVKAIAEVSDMYECFQSMKWVRRQQARAIGRAMGFPTFPTLSKISVMTRVKDYWELAWNEDHMVISQNLLPTMSDEEVYDYAWRRYLAPYDKKLTREQLIERIEDYWVVLGGDKFVQEGKTCNIYVLTTYCFSHYFEPGFLEGDISELDGNDFENISQWGKDVYLQRLEFENGPLRDQAEAYGQKKIEEREAKLKALEGSA